jgi:hypothetical protein
LRQLVLQAPAAVIPDALGFHQKSTARQVAHAGATWSRYTAGDRVPPVTRSPVCRSRAVGQPARGGAVVGRTPTSSMGGPSALRLRASAGPARSRYPDNEPLVRCIGANRVR